MNESDTDRYESKDQWSPPLVHCNLTAWDNRRECLMEKQEQPCLFNIKTDPCEFDNIADRLELLFIPLNRALQNLWKCCNGVVNMS